MGRQAQPREIIDNRRVSVKAEIVDAGVKLGDIARAVGISQSTLTAYLVGRLRNPHRQLQIFMTYLALSKRTMTMVAFWGDLLAKEVA